MHKAKLLRSHYTRDRCFFCEICEDFKNTFENINSFVKDLRTATPV